MQCGGLDFKWFLQTEHISLLWCKKQANNSLEKLHLLGKSHGKFRGSTINSRLLLLLLLKSFPRLPKLSNLAAF